jgi:class 3 adenylate cyclase/Tfp pilus assembly protein PilF
MKLNYTQLDCTRIFKKVKYLPSRLIILLIFFNFQFFSFNKSISAQNSFYGTQKADSILGIWENTSLSDSVRLSAAHELVWRVYLQNDPDSARIYAENQLALALQNGSLKYISSAYNNIGVTFHAQGDLKNALPYYRKSLEADMEKARLFPKDLDALKGIALSQSNMAILYQQLGDIPMAMENYFRALELLDSLEKSGLPLNSKIADVQNNIGLLQEGQTEFDDALKWYFRALKRYKIEAPSPAQGNVLNNIGNALTRLSNIAENEGHRDSLSEKGLSYFKHSLKVRQKIGDRRGEANALNNIATHYQKQSQVAEEDSSRIRLIKKAEDYYRQSLIMVGKVKDRVEMGKTYVNLSYNLILQERILEAIEYAELGLKIGKETSDSELLFNASGKLFIAYKRMGRSKDALEMHELYVQMGDSIRNEQNTRLLMRKQFDYDYSKREALLVAEQEKRDAINSLEIDKRKMQRNAFIGGFILMFALAGISFYSYRQKKEDNAIIIREKDRSEALLLNILPEEVAEELKAKGSADAQLIDEVTVLFTDFKGFTAMSENLSPKELVEDLHQCFSAFDHIMEKYGIEKIKTIGDAYMAAGGLPTPNKTHPQDVVKAALEMAEVVERGKEKKIAEGLAFFEVRIGVHTGPVVAGIVGVKKFQYDIWGDTVNTASRMESSGEVGKVNISESTYELLKDTPDFEFEPRGKIKAKGKGEIEMLFVTKKIKKLNK